MHATVATAGARTIEPAGRLDGELRLPGDKSISHRALMRDLLPVHEHVRGLHDGTAPVVAEIGAAAGGLSRH